MDPNTLKLFYRLKPLIPRWLQIELRRVRARRIQRIRKDIWPIDEKAAIPPENWKGWPGGRRFAFIITHDVDTARGHERCRSLMRLEQAVGFTSSYNFVPERYKVSQELRDTLDGNGFEVGVHGLNHDGKYFTSREIWEERATRINRYIEEWGSVGFRMPSVQHNLAWMHDLKIEYDSSTFDTDPFEPQPDGAGTIFPFWVSSGNGNSGYVEMPYSLPQDFTLFIILKQKTNDIWKKKLDWVASKGGMALLLVHPDYIETGDGRNGAEEYPLSFYADFLRFVRDTYKGEYYHVLPRELAKFWKENYGDPR